MRLSDLRYDFPEELIATEPRRPSRILLVSGEAASTNNSATIGEINWEQLISQFQPGDALVLNDTKVLKRRIFAGDLEILFLETEMETIQPGKLGKIWQVLFPSKKFKVGDEIELPLGIQMKLLAKGRPQVVETSEVLTEAYFEKVAEIPLPPYIQKARGERHNVAGDASWYQTSWAEKPGSFAAPTASLHFTEETLAQIQKQGVNILKITLHVGLGTFLPVAVEDLDDHKMHSEFVEISADVWQKILLTKKSGGRVWSLGTTSTRALESQALGLFQMNGKSFSGFTDLLIQPGFQWQVVDRLLTNFHQPESTLLALVAAFSDLATVRRAYQMAIAEKFRLFSYGDLSVWIK